MAITIEGNSYKVTENLGYSHDMGCQAKAVAIKNGERIAIKVGGKWKFRGVNSVISVIRPLPQRDS